MNKKHCLSVLVILISIASVVFAQEPSELIEAHEFSDAVKTSAESLASALESKIEEHTLLQKYIELREPYLQLKYGIAQIREQYEKSSIRSSEVEAILGQPDNNRDETIWLLGAKEVWCYRHPFSATIRYLFLFNDDDRLMMMTSAQILHPKIGNLYYDVEHFFRD